MNNQELIEEARDCFERANDAHSSIEDDDTADLVLKLTIQIRRLIPALESALADNTRLREALDKISAWAHKLKIRSEAVSIDDHPGALPNMVSVEVDIVRAGIRTTLGAEEAGQ